MSLVIMEINLETEETNIAQLTPTARLKVVKNVVRIYDFADVDRAYGGPNYHVRIFHDGVKIMQTAPAKDDGKEPCIMPFK